MTFDKVTVPIPVLAREFKTLGPSLRPAFSIDLPYAYQLHSVAKRWRLFGYKTIVEQCEVRAFHE
jgi:hypothetical protein